MKARDGSHEDTEAMDFHPALHDISFLRPHHNKAIYQAPPLTD
jgi:hypothetical protein